MSLVISAKSAKISLDNKLVRRCQKIGSYLLTIRMLRANGLARRRHIFSVCATMAVAAERPLWKDCHELRLTVAVSGYKR